MNHSFVSTLLRNNRKKSRLTVNEVVILLNHDYHIQISAKTLYSWENDQTQPPISTFLALCEIYHIKNIYHDIKFEKERGPVPLKLTEEEREIILKYRSRNYCNSAIRKLLDID